MKIYILIFLFLQGVGGLYSATPFKSYSVADGMPNSTIKAICQDSLGYIWMGTRNGLVRFDGYEFRSYNYDIQEENSGSSNDITCFTPGKNGLIWIGTFNWITLFDPFSEKFIDLKLHEPDDISHFGVVTNIWIDASDKVWVSSKTGLYVIEKGTVRAVLKGAYINSMCAVDNENLIIDVVGKGIALFNTAAERLKYMDESYLPNRPMIIKMLRDRQGKIWLGGNCNHIYNYNPQNNSLAQAKIKFPSNTRFENDQIHDILEYNDSILVFGSDNGLFSINKYTLDYLPYIVPGLETDFLSKYRVMCLFKDHQDAIWTGTFGKGVKYTNPNRYFFNFYDLGFSSEMSAGVVGNIVEQDGVLWFGHEQGLSCMDLSTGKITHVDLKSFFLKHDQKQEVFFLYHNGEPDILYFYLLNYGTFAFNTKTRRIVKQLHLNPASQVRSIATDKIGKLWIAEEELSIYDPASGKLNSGLSTNINNITTFTLTQELLPEHNGNMLVGTRTSGVWEYLLDEQETNKYFVARQLNYDCLKNKNINVLFEDSRSNLWVGTYSSGLFYCDKEKKDCVVYNTENGLAGNTICGIIENEKTHDIWVTTINSVSQISPQSGKIINHTGKTGFPLEEVARKAFFKASNGLYYIGGNNGLASFNPELFDNAVVAPRKVAITLVESLIKGISLDNSKDLQRVEIPFWYSSIVIKFSSFNFFFPQSDKYKYMLQGIDKDWNVSERNEVVYTNLPDGEYVFNVKVDDGDDKNNPVTTLRITVLPPFWRTIWAKIFYALIIIVIVYFLIRFFYQLKTAKYRQQINQIEKDNLERYYKLKIDLFTKFSHEFRTPLTLIAGPAEDMVRDETLPDKFRYLVDLIHKNANRLLLLVNQLMDVRKIEHGAMILNVSQVDINSFLSEQVENFSEITKKKNINLSYRNQYWEKDVWFDTELMEKVISNLISNAIKHTHKGGEITIASKEQDNYLRISVRDNGEGIPKEHIEEIFNPFYQVERDDHKEMAGSGIGLNLAKYVVNLHGGSIWAESVLGQGSEFFVQLPFGTQHFDESHTKIIAKKESVENEKLQPSIEPITPYPADESISESKTWLLIAEDDNELRQYIVSQLSADYSLIESTDGREALSLAIEKIPDLIISDIMMPNMDGIQLCKNVKENINTAHIPIILLTAKVMNENIREGYEALADDYIVKPFDFNLLKVRIKNLIDNRLQLRKFFSNQLVVADAPLEKVASIDPLMKKLFRIVEERIDDSTLSINDIASELGTSRTQLFRKIRAVSGLSPNQLIINIRMKMAADMLRTKQYTITEVAYKVGFTEPGYFSKTFKSIFNLRPSEYVKSQEKNA